MIFYYCLAQGFNYPTPELAQMIKEETFADVITAAAKQLGFEVASAVEQLKNSICGFQSENQLLSELQSEYTYLFINAPGHLPVPPYASVHLSKDQLCGLKIHEVLEFYRAAGVGVPSSFSDPPDHLAVELEYMVYLLQNNLLELRERFLKEHFLLWVPSFSATYIAQGRRTPRTRSLRYAATSLLAFRLPLLLPHSTKEHAMAITHVRAMHITMAMMFHALPEGSM